MTISEWLEDIDSHGVYDATILTELAKMGMAVVAGDAEYEIISPSHGGSVSVPVMSHEQTRRAIEARGLGGGLDDPSSPGQRFVVGHQLAAALALLVTGTNPGAMFHGRGTSFRHNLQAIKESEEKREV